MIRKMSVAGSFYPNDKNELNNYFTHFNHMFDSNKLPKVNPKAIIVPHAGYIYSGFTADVAYRVLANSSLKNFVIIGPSHRVRFEGISLCECDAYETPIENIQNAKTIQDKLQTIFGLKFIKEAHSEHSTETQFPFVKHYMPKANILELVYSKIQPNFLSEIIDFILTEDDCGVIISTDLSHFYDLKSAQKLDSICLQSVANLNLEMLSSRCEACGKIGLEAMIISSINKNLKPNILDYRTSADASKDQNRVVGYMSAYFID